MRPRGRNAYTLRVPNGPTTPITEPANVLVPPVAPAAGTQQPPPRVDSVQTLTSSSSFATASTSSSYVDDVRYYRNCSYETQASVATSRAPGLKFNPTHLQCLEDCTVRLADGTDDCAIFKERHQIARVVRLNIQHTLDILQLRTITRPWKPPTQIIGGHKEPQKTTLIHILLVRTDLIGLEEAIGVFYQSFLVKSRRQII